MGRWRVTYDTTSSSCARVPCLQALVVVAFSQIIGALQHEQSASDIYSVKEQDMQFETPAPTVCTTTLRPTILSGPFSVSCSSSTSKTAIPDEFDWMFPKSPTCRSESVGAPCVFAKGLKCAPAEVQPFVASPRALWREDASHQY